MVGVAIEALGIVGQTCHSLAVDALQRYSSTVGSMMMANALSAALETLGLQSSTENLKGLVYLTWYREWYARCGATSLAFDT